MALALRSASRLKPEVILAQAISEFEGALTAEQKSTFRTFRTQSLQSVPRPEDVMRFSAELNVSFKGRRASRCLGPRFTNILQTIQQYAALGDIVVSSSQNVLACSMWALVRLSLQLVVGLTSYLERISTFFMDVGRSSPRYQSMALLYPRSTNLRAYLCNYFTVITRVCLQFVTFSHKSLLGQLAASLDESKLRTAQTELEKWSGAIREEVDFLHARTVEDEARENSRFRALVNIATSSDTYRRQLRRRLDFLDSCSKIDFETPWKQARKIGTSTVFVNETYKSWKQETSSPTLVLMGKLGSGKSVTMANIVDDIYLLGDSLVTVYFFCRHDIPEGLTARTIVGCLFRQLLQLCIHDAALDDLIDGFRPQPSLDYILGIVEKVFPLRRGIRCLIDGLDECSVEEAVQVLGWFRKLRTTLNVRCCISIRTTAETKLVSVPNLGNFVLMHIPDDNPDIAEYINAEIQDRIVTGQLKIGTPTLALEIRDTLVHGANGMFLWVSLQLQSLCEEESDEAIRDALKDLPHDLHETFERILMRAQKGRKIEYQGPILKLVSAAYRPLTVYELREALSVQPGDPVWHRNRLVNDIRATISCCGSLVIVDEEELSVRLVHQSVRQFLFSPRSPASQPSPWHFTLDEAHRRVGEIAVTYLNYGTFETRLTTTVVPTMPAAKLADRVMEDALSPAGMTGKLALMLLRATTPSASGSDVDFGRAIAEIQSQHRQKAVEVEIFHFLSYASRYWLPHTSWIDHESTFYDLWLQVLQNPKFDTLPWAHGQQPADDVVVDEESGRVWQVSTTIAWSISHDHMAVLKAELTGRNWAHAFGSVMPYLSACYARASRPNFSARVATKLLPFTALFNSGAIAQWLLSMGADISVDDFQVVREAVLRRAYDFLKTAIGLRDNPEQADPNVNTLACLLLQLGCQSGDAHLVYLVCRRGGFTAAEAMPALEITLDNVFYNPSQLRIAFQLFTRGLVTHFPRRYSTSGLCQLLFTCRAMANPSIFSPVASIGNGAAYNNSCKLLGKFLVHASLRGDLAMAQMVLDHRHSPYELSDRAQQYIDAALYARSPERSEIVQRYLQSSYVRVTFLRRCIELREWTLAQEAVNRGETIDLSSFSVPLLHLCADSGDLQGLNFLSENFEVDINASSDSSIFGVDTPMQAALKSESNDARGMCIRLDVIERLIELEADPGIHRGDSEACLDLALKLGRDAVSVATSNPIFTEQDRDVTFARIESTIERFLTYYDDDNNNNNKDTPGWQPPRLGNTIIAYLEEMGKYHHIAWPADPLFRHALSVKGFYLKIIEMLLRHGHVGGGDAVVRDRFLDLGGVLRFLLASHGFDISAIPLADRLMADTRPLVLQAASLGKNFLGVVKDMLLDEQLTVNLQEAPLFVMGNTAESSVERGVLIKAYSLLLNEAIGGSIGAT